MRKIINVQRSRDDTKMWIVIHDAVRCQYEVWFIVCETYPVTSGLHVETFEYERRNFNAESAARIQAKHLTRDLSDAA